MSLNGFTCKVAISSILHFARGENLSREMDPITLEEMRMLLMFLLHTNYQEYNLCSDTNDGKNMETFSFGLQCPCPCPRSTSLFHWLDYLA